MHVLAFLAHAKHSDTGAERVLKFVQVEVFPDAGYQGWCWFS